MSAAALAHDAFSPRRPPGMGPGLVLALIAHALLIVALAWSVNWKTSEPEGVVAELWSTLPQIAAPRVSAPEPRPPVVVEPRPVPPAPQPEPVAPPRVDAQIAIERAEAAKKAEAAKRDEARRVQAEREKELERQRLADEQAEKKKLAEKTRQDEAKQAAIREANLRKMMAQAGASDDPAATGKGARTSGPSASYAGRIKAYMRPFIKTPGTLSGDFRTEVEVRLSPDGSILSTRVTRPSGSAVWDSTVLRALENAQSLPRDDGRVYSPMLLEFRSNE
jgi:colicin import membrane protein